MSFSVENPSETVSAVVEKYADVPGGLMPLLHELQATLGQIPKDQVARIASGMGLSRAEVHGVIGFYHDFRYERGGQVIIHVCRAEACQAMGSAKLEEHVKTRLGVEFGETTSDGRFSLQPVYCLGNCACSPSVRFGDDIHARVDARRFDALLEKY